MSEGTIIYNQTFHVANHILSRWKQWVKETYIPQVLATGGVQEASLLKLLHQDESEGATYAVQFRCSDGKAYEAFHNAHSKQLADTIGTAWGQDCLYFSTVLAVVN